MKSLAMAAVLVCLFGVAACSDEPAGAADGPPSIPRSVPADAGELVDSASTDGGGDVASDVVDAESPAVVSSRTDGVSSGGPDSGPTEDPVAPVNCVVWADDAADPSEALFDPACVLDVRIEMPPQDWTALRNQTRALADVVQGDCLDAPPTEVFDWFQAHVTVSGRGLSSVGIRKKGFVGSLSEEKPSLKVRFDKFADGLSLAGLRRLTLNNAIQDPSLVSACLGYGLMAQVGIAAPRCNFAKVSVNGEELGLYVHVDSVKKPFISRHFTSDEGNLYEATISDFRPEFRGTWEKKTNATEDDWSDLNAAVEALALPDDALMDALADVFDLDAFYTFWAMEVLIAHWDGYAGNRNNSYVYADPVDGLFRFIPWGLDSAFLDPQLFIGGDQDLPGAVFAFGHLANRLYAHPVGRAAYVARMVELLDTLWDATALRAELERMEELLAAHLTDEETAALAAAISAKRSWITVREQRVRAELTVGPKDWEYPPAQTICWIEGGTMTGTFDTRWGTSGGDFLDQPGSLNHDVPTLDFIGNVASSARFGAGVTEGQAVIELMGNNNDGEYFLVYIFGPLDRYTSHTTQPLDWLVFSGVVGRVDVLEFDFEPVALLVDGVIHFEETSTFLGEPVTGSFEATVIQPP